MYSSLGMDEGDMGKKIDEKEEGAELWKNKIFFLFLMVRLHALASDHSIKNMSC